MRGAFSAIDPSTRMGIKDLLSRFCHALDHGRTGDWAALFRPDAKVAAPRFGTFEGRDAITAIPEFVASEGSGAWRHVFNNIVIDGCGIRREYRVRAYCTVNDWRRRGEAIRCWDFEAKLVKTRMLKLYIAELEMRPVGEFCKDPRSYLRASPNDISLVLTD